MDFKLWLEATDQFIDKLIDPALLTFKEFWQLINPEDKYHRSDAYAHSLKDMKDNKSKYPTVLFRKIINGISFEFRILKKDRYLEKFVKHDEHHRPVSINGEFQYYTVEELQKLKVRRYDHKISAFDGDQQVGFTADEWGCLLVVVADEYHQFGIGTILTKLAWEAEPGKDSGGCTPRGAALTRKVHGEFVREYLQKGFYSYLVKQGKMTAQRAKQIIDSADLRIKKSNLNLSNDNPDDWLLYARDGTFIVYDKKLKDVIENEDIFWSERFIKAFAFVGGGHDEKIYILHQIGGDTEKLKKFAFKLAVGWANEEGDLLKVYDEDIHLAGEEYEVEKGMVKLKSPPVDYKYLSRQEAKWRKSFDKYGEFEYRLLELADAKYR